MSKATKMFRAYLALENKSANTKTYDEFLSYISDYKNFCEIEKLAKN